MGEKDKLRTSLDLRVTACRSCHEFLSKKLNPVYPFHPRPPLGSRASRRLLPMSDCPSRSLHSTLVAPPWDAPRARAPIDSGCGAAFPPLSAPRAGRIAHLATRKPDQDGSPAALGRFSRATDENGRADRLHNAAMLRRLCKLTTTKTSLAGRTVIPSGVLRLL